MVAKKSKRKIYDFSEHRRRLGAKIKEARQAKGWTQEEMPDRIYRKTGHDISLHTIEKIEQGTMNFTIEKLWAILFTLGYNPDDSFPAFEKPDSLTNGTK